MSFRPGVAVLHAAAFAVLSYGYRDITTSQSPTDDWIRAQKGGFLQYLTIQQVILSCLSMAFSLLADVFPQNRAIKRVKRLSTMLAIPFSVIVTLGFWSMALLNPKLIRIPARSPVTGLPVIENGIPVLHQRPMRIDLEVHLYPALFVILDFYAHERRFSRVDVRFWAPAMIAAFGAWYISWVEWLNVHNGRFPYPFLNVPLSRRIPLYLTGGLAAYSIFGLLNSWHPGAPPQEAL